VWCVLTEGELSAAPFGVPIVILALAASAALAPEPAPRWSVVGLLRFGLAFVTGSLRGGVDVAVRALSPRLALDPAIVRYPLRLEPGPARLLFMGALSLMPGTLSVTAEGSSLLVHVLSARGGDLVLRQLETLEGHVAQAFGERSRRRDA
jgi:multicomponent Na+:H+ antiporter subunit E